MVVLLAEGVIGRVTVQLLGDAPEEEDGASLVCRLGVHILVDTFEVRPELCAGQVSGLDMPGVMRPDVRPVDVLPLRVRRQCNELTPALVANGRDGRAFGQRQRPAGDGLFVPQAAQRQGHGGN